MSGWDDGARDVPEELLDGSISNGNGLAVERHGAALVDWSTFWSRDDAPSDWLADPFLARGRSHALYAPAKTGKSLFGLYVVAALATGRAVLNQGGQAPIHTVYFDMEMTEADLYERLSDFGYGPEVDMSHLHYYVLPSLYPLDGPLGGSEVVELAAHHTAELVVIDTTARAVQGKENDADTIRAFYAHTGRPLKSAGRTVLRLDHAGKDPEKGQRGTSAKADDVDVVWRLTPRDGGNLRLDATHRRVSWVPTEVELVQSDDPLRYSVGQGSWPAGTADVAGRLDKANVPLSTGRIVARQLLVDAGLEGGRNELLAAALRYRRVYQA